MYLKSAFALMRLPTQVKYLTSMREEHRALALAKLDDAEIVATLLANIREKKVDVPAEWWEMSNNPDVPPTVIYFHQNQSIPL